MSWGIVLGIVSALQSEKSRQDTKDYQEAVFNNEKEAAYTNGMWQLKDNELAYKNEQALKDNLYWNTRDNINFKDEQGRTEADIQVEYNNAKVEAQIDELDAKTINEITAIMENYQTDMDYKISMTTSAKEYNSAKATLDALNIRTQTNASLALLKQDINTVKKQLKQALTDMDISKQEGLGQELVKMSESLATGGSSTRRMLAARNKADRAKATQVSNVDSSIDKAYANMSTTKATGATQEYNTIVENVAQNNRLDSELQATLDSLLANKNTTVDKLQNDLDATITAIEEERTAYNTNILDSYQYEVDKAIAKLDGEYAADKEYSQTEYEYQQYQTGRSISQTLDVMGDNQDTLDKMSEFTDSAYYDYYEEGVVGTYGTIETGSTYGELDVTEMQTSLQDKLDRRNSNTSTGDGEAGSDMGYTGGNSFSDMASAGADMDNSDGNTDE